VASPHESPEGILSSSDVRLLSDIGFVAACSSQRERAVQIFQALTLFRPLKAFPYLGLAVANLNAKKPAEAILALALGKRVLAAAPIQSDDVKEDYAMLGVFEGLAAQADNRRIEGLKLIEGALDGAPSSGPAYRLGQRLLGLGATDENVPGSAIHSRNKN
jgi:hypothetical protein